MIVKRIAEQIQAHLADKEKVSKISRYELAKRLGVSHQVVAHWFNADPKAIKLEHLCKLRKISGLSWTQFGKLIDEEFGSLE